MFTNDTISWRSRSRDAGLVRRLGLVLSRHGVDLLRISLGLVFLLFGTLKFFPGLSPAEDLVVRTVGARSFGLLPGQVGLVMVAGLEVFIGLTLLSGRWLLPGLVAIGLASVGFFAPLLLFAREMFAGGPTLEAQYALKDLILVAAALVVAAKALGGRMVVADSPA